MSLLILVRHGQSQWNLENRFTGWVDVDITPAGEAEAHRAGLALKPYAIDACFTSALKRAQRTLEIVLEAAGKTGLPISRSEALNERMYGDLQGMDKAETAQKYGAEQVHIWRRSWDVPPPNGESLKDTLERVLPYYSAHIEPLLRAGQNVLVTAHGNSLRALVMHLEGMTPEQILQFEIPTGTPRVYELGPELQVRKAEFLAVPNA
jgi:2,3-bisphosphoglycerate-dependent phosphoglycerate mutase